MVKVPGLLSAFLCTRKKTLLKGGNFIIFERKKIYIWLSLSYHSYLLCTVVFFTVNTVHCIFHSVHGLIAGLDRELGYWDLTTDAEIRHFPAVAGGSGKDKNNVKF